MCRAEESPGDPGAWDVRTWVTCCGCTRRRKAPGLQAGSAENRPSGTPPIPEKREAEFISRSQDRQPIRPANHVDSKRLPRSAINFDATKGVASNIDDQIARIETGAPNRIAILKAITDLQTLWDHLTIGERRRLVSTLIERIDHDPVGSTISITLSPAGLQSFGSGIEEHES